MASNYRDQMKYAVDMVFCIDATMSMYPILDEVKNRAITFYQDFKTEMDAKGKKVGSLRIRIVAFRDYFYDQEEAMLETDFFELPQMAETFEQVIKSIEPSGGGDDPEDGLEALYYAMKSDWFTGPAKKRHVIVVWTDSGTHPLGFGKSVDAYPAKMAKDFSELSAMWGNSYEPGMMDQSAKRLLLFAPDEPGWTNIRNSGWDNVIHVVTDQGMGLRDKDYNEILDVITNSI